MKPESSVAHVPRSLVFPVVFAICALAFLLGAGTLIVRPWFIHSFDKLDAAGVGHADIDVVFRRIGGLLAMLLIAIPVLLGGWLLRRRESHRTEVAWFSALSLFVLSTWCMSVGLVLHNTYIALFTSFA
jgi:hypothetical protein